MPNTIALTPEAVAVLRFEIKGYRSKSKERRLPAYCDLAAAGIMEPVPGAESDFRFTQDAWNRREEILREAEERIERERFEPPDASQVSEAAKELLRRIVAGEPVDVDETRRPLYRELVAARIMLPVHTFVGGREATYRFTYWGWERRFELAEQARARETA
jgi:hypothetical protein